MKFLISCFILLVLTIQSVAADYKLNKSITIYKYFDAKGVLHLSNQPPKSKQQLLYARSYLILSYPLQPIFQPKLRKKPVKSKGYASMIKAVASKVNLSPALLHAVVQVESAYNPKAVSPKGAVGLMQLMPATAKQYGVVDRTNPVANLNGGARYLRYLLTLFNEDLNLALAAYNAGENAVRRYSNTIPPYKETRNYVKKVQKLYKNYLLNSY